MKTTAIPYKTHFDFGCLRATIFLTLILSLVACSKQLSQEEVALVKQLTSENAELQKDIAVGEVETAKYPGGLLGLLIKSRLEIQKTNSALLQQRIHAIESGAKLKVEVHASSADPEKAKALSEEIKKQEASIVKAEATAAQSGGLIGVMNEMALSTEKNTLAMLKQQYLIQKFGLAAPSLKAAELKAVTDAPSPPRTPQPMPNASDKPAQSVKEQILVPTLLRKRLVKQDYRDFMSLELAFDPKGLDKPTRALKGVLKFTDLFGEQKFGLKWTIDTPITPGTPFTETGSGFDFNKFNDGQQWVQSTAIENMKIIFQVESIIYQDGSTREID